MFSLVHLRCLSALALAALGASGCSQNLEQNPTFQEQVTHLNRVDEDQKAASRQLSSLDADFQQVSRDVAKLAGKAPGGSADAIKALEQRVAQLEQRLAEGGAKAAATNNPAPESAAPESAASKTAAPKSAADAAEEVVDNAPPNAPTPGRAPVIPGKKLDGKRLMVVGKPAASGTKARKRVERRASAPRAARRAASGTYYLVQRGDTLEKIAAQQHASAQAIMEANHLPVTATLAPGQTIYVPQAAR